MPGTGVIEVRRLSSLGPVSGKKGVSRFVPFALIGVFSAAQLLLGTSPVIVAMAAFAVAVPLLPLGLYGRDIYALMGINFALRYVGIALVGKTFYGQTLESNLFDPYAAYALTGLLMVVVTTVLIFVRKLDRRKALFPLPTVITIPIGIAAQIVVAANKSLDTGAFNGGPVLRQLWRSYSSSGWLLRPLTILCSPMGAASSVSGSQF
jgi:hypothetical protein